MQRTINTGGSDHYNRWKQEIIISLVFLSIFSFGQSQEFFSKDFVIGLLFVFTDIIPITITKKDSYNTDNERPAKYEKCVALATEEGEGEVAVIPDVQSQVDIHNQSGDAFSKCAQNGRA